MLSRVKQSGVTLLEIMLVLAIAAMIIMMSVRYYENASSSNEANEFLSQVQSITAAVENLAGGSGAYTTSASKTNVQNTLGQTADAGWLTAPWGGLMTYTATTTGFQLTSIPQPSSAVCTLITTKMSSSPKYSMASPCTSFTYDATK